MLKKINITEVLFRTTLRLLNNYAETIPHEGLMDYTKNDIIESSKIDIILREIFSQNQEVIAVFLNYILNKIDEVDKTDFISSINADSNFTYIYYSDISLSPMDVFVSNVISPIGKKLTRKQDLIKNGESKGSIFYFPNKELQEDLDSKDISYNVDSCILRVYGKKINFSSTNIEKSFIECLYLNQNQAINASHLKVNGVKDGIQTLKNIRKKLENGNNAISPLETRILFSNFTYDKEKYFIMHIF